MQNDQFIAKVSKQLLLGQAWMNTTLMVTTAHVQWSNVDTVISIIHGHPCLSFSCFWVTVYSHHFTFSYTVNIDLNQKKKIGLGWPQYYLNAPKCSIVFVLMFRCTCAEALDTPRLFTCSFIRRSFKYVCIFTREWYLVNIKIYANVHTVACADSVLLWTSTDISAIDLQWTLQLITPTCTYMYESIIETTKIPLLLTFAGISFFCAQRSD